MTSEQAILRSLAVEKLGVEAPEVQALRAHGSARKIFRLHFSNRATAIGIINESKQENSAFIAFSRSFLSLGLPVPEILASSEDGAAYIETDLGNETLMDVLGRERKSNDVGPKVNKIYRKALDHLLIFQTNGLGAIDTRFCYQGARFDPLAVKRDLSYFASEYLERVGIPSKDLDKDFDELAMFSDSYERGYFMFRDFQSRNIMVVDNEPWYIDYQSGREGPLQYDVASLLFQSQADLPFKLREELFDYYVERLSTIVKFDIKRFTENYHVYVLIRALQNLGAYGKLGLAQGKEYFKNSIPYALRNCAYLLSHWPSELAAPTLRARLELAAG